jgi:hypothetical protein
MVYSALEQAMLINWQLPFAVDALSFILGVAVGVTLLVLLIAVIWLAVKL